MVDVVDKETRSRMMSGIRGKDTKPELAVRQGLHARGFRFRLHVRSLPGNPDIVFPRYNVIVLVHGCFWHGHGCRYYKLPGTNRDFWKAKIEGNQQRDARNRRKLTNTGWRVITVWECALRDRTDRQRTAMLDRLARRIRRGKG
jgi:DNA mismatch endonuclease, patch repair protein